MTREKAIDLLEGIIKGTDESPLYDAIRMAVEALKAQEPEEDYCEACQIYYPEDEA